MADDKGFIIKDFAEIKADIDSTAVAELGDVNLEPPSILSVLIAIFAERVAGLWERLEANHNSFFPSTAEGYNLDSVGSYNGLIRKKATYSKCLAQITAINYTKIDKGARVAINQSGDIFLLQDDIVVNNEKCYQVGLEILNDTAVDYTITINGVNHVHTTTVYETKAEIAEELVLLVDALDDITATSSENIIVITSDIILTSFICYVSTDDIRMLQVTNNAEFIAEEIGAIPAPAQSLIDIKTPISGLISVDNIQAGTAGDVLESDIAFRERRGNSLKGGAGTLEAIRANILNLTGVTSVLMFENNTKETVGDLPPETYKFLVGGGDDQEIAEAIWQYKPAGNAPIGDVTKVVLSSDGISRNISFSRAIKQYIFMNIDITTNEQYLATSGSVIQNNVTNAINALGGNGDVIINSLYGPVFSEQGVETAIITLASSLTETPVPALSNVDITIASTDVAVTDISKIVITEV